MAVMQVNPTRMELTNTKRRLKTAVRGHKLMRDKRDEMVRRFMEVIRKNQQLRQQVEGALTVALKEFAMARAQMSAEALENAVLFPSRRVEIEAGLRNVMSVDVPRIDIVKNEATERLPYGYAMTSAQLDGAIQTIAEMLPLLIQLAEVEKTCDRLADEIEKTRRRVNALEYVMIPQMEESIRYITMKLDENERGNLTRLMKVKDMLAERDA